jgi:NADH/NAD ratio-sensing transcriptional regulator Rex
MIAALSQGSLQRLPQYLIMLKSEAQLGHGSVTADDIGAVVKVSPSQVRHDLSGCGANRAPGECYDVKELTGLIEHALGYDDISNAVIVGAGPEKYDIEDYEALKQKIQELDAAYVAGFEAISEEKCVAGPGVPVYDMVMKGMFIANFVRGAICQVLKSEYNVESDLISGALLS